MTVETLVSTEIEQARPLSPAEEAVDASPDNSLAAAQFEAIIRAWKGEAVEGAVPASPVGEVDWDGSLGLGQLDPSKLGQLCQWTWLDYSFFCSFGCPTVECSNYCTIDPPTCFPACQYG